MHMIESVANDTTATVVTAIAQAYTYKNITFSVTHKPCLAIILPRQLKDNGFGSYYGEGTCICIYYNGNSYGLYISNNIFTVMESSYLPTWTITDTSVKCTIKSQYSFGSDSLPMIYV